MSIRIGNLSDENLHPKSAHNKVGSLGSVTVWRYTTWEPFTWHYRAEKPDGRSYQGKAFTRWGARAEAHRYLDPVWDEYFS